MAADLQEIKLDESHSNEGKDCYIEFEYFEFYYSSCGKTSKGVPHGGVGILLCKNSGLSDCIWNGINSTIIWVLRKFNGTKIAFFSVYAPTNDYEVEERVAFYDELDSQMKRVPINAIVIFLGDFNARIGANFFLDDEIGTVCGPYGGIVRGEEIEMDANGELLLGFCVRHDLMVAESFFDRSDQDFGTWKSPKESNFNYPIDHIIVRKNHFYLVQKCSVVPELDLRSNHRALELCLSVPQEKVPSKKRYYQRKAKEMRNKGRTETDKEEVVIKRDYSVLNGKGEEKDKKSS